MATKKSTPFFEDLREQPCTLDGLRAAFDLELQRRIAEHHEAAALAASKKKSIAAGKPGSAGYSAEISMKESDFVAEMLKSVFRVSSNRNDRPLHLEQGQADRFIDAVLTHFPPYRTFDVQEWFSKRTAQLIEGMGGIGAFSLRFVNTTRPHVFYDEPQPAGAVPPVVCSLTVPNSAGAGAVANMGKSALNEALNLLGQRFVYDGRNTCIHMELCTPNSRFFDGSRYFTPDLVATLRGVKRGMPLQDGTPMILWPVGQKGESAYHALSPVPSIAVLDALVYKNNKQSPIPDTFIPRARLVVGGTKAQNAGAFNNEVMGTYPIFNSALSASSSSPERLFLSKFVWRKDWLNRLATEDVQSLSHYSYLQGYAHKENYLRSFAKAVVSKALLHVLPALDYLDAPLSEIPEQLKSRLAENDVYLLFTEPSPENLEAVSRRLIGLIGSADTQQTLMHDEDLRKRLVKSVSTALRCFGESPQPQQVPA